MSCPEPIYTGEAGENDATIRPAAPAPDLVYPGGVRVRYLGRGSGTRGLFGPSRWDLGPASTGPDPHFPRSIHESFFVLTGTVSVHGGTGWKPARPGGYFHVPEGGIHGDRNIEGENASMVLLFAPGAPREEEFETLARIADNPLSPEARAQFMARHDTYWI